MSRATELSLSLRNHAKANFAPGTFTCEALNEAAALLLDLERELAEARKDAEEQARLVGMGAQRELRLMAERDQARRELNRVIVDLPIG